MDEQEFARVAAWATKLEPRDLAAASVHAVRRIFLDDIGAMIAGHRDSEVREVLDGWPLLPGSATVLAPRGGSAHPWSAAEVNSLAGCWLEVDGGFRLNTAHAGLYTLPTVIAIAEERDLTLGVAFAAVIAGYEVAARIVTRWDLVAANTHAHGSVSAAAAAGAAGRALGLDEAQWLDAVSSAVTLSAAAPFDHAFAGAVVRNLWAAAGNRVGQVAVHAAVRGVAGLPRSIDTTYRDVFETPLWEGARLPDELGTAVQFAYQKSYACCGYLHSAVEAVLDLQREESFEAGDITRVTVRIHPHGMALNDTRPSTTLGARFSAPHAVAATLVTGIATPQSFNAASLDNPAIRDLRERVEMVPIDRPDRDPALRDAEVELELTDGQRVARYVAIAIGDPARPMTDEQLVSKAAALTGRDASRLADTLLGADLETPFADVSAAIRELIA